MKKNLTKENSLPLDHLRLTGIYTLFIAPSTFRKFLLLDSTFSGKKMPPLSGKDK